MFTQENSFFLTSKWFITTLFQLTIITRFVVCLQINFSLHKGPWIFNLGLLVVWTGTQWFWTGTHDFLLDESKDSPYTICNKISEWTGHSGTYLKRTPRMQAPGRHHRNSTFWHPGIFFSQAWTPKEGTRVGFEWVCAAKVFKFGPQCWQDVHSKWYGSHILEIVNFYEFLPPRVLSF